MKYKLVIFDFDGTLADSFPWLVSVANQVADRYRFRKIEATQLETLRSYSATTMLKHLGIPPWRVPIIGNHIRTLMAQNISRIHLFEGIDRLLQELADNGVTLAIVTSNSFHNVQQVLGPQSAALISHYECGVSMFGKAGKLGNVLRDSGIPREQALCIGDEIRDWEATRKAHIAFGAVAWGATALSTLQACSPEEIFVDVNDISRCIQRQPDVK